MGIHGLLPALKPLARGVHVSAWRGALAGVDGHAWLHAACCCCSLELATGAPTDKYTAAFMSRVRLLQRNGVTPLVVFDGRHLPLKAGTAAARSRAREAARAKGEALLAAGDAPGAARAFQGCIMVTPGMVKRVIEQLRASRVAFLVAPYEADAQLAYLARCGAVGLVVTEDSDLLAYAVPRILYKLDAQGCGDELRLSDISRCPALPLASFSAELFLQLCVLAGCDYLPALPGVGLKRAHEALCRYGGFVQALKALRFFGAAVPPDYEARFQLALWTFKHARVWCPAAQALVHLTPLPPGGLVSDVPGALELVLQMEQPPGQQPAHEQLRLDFLGPPLADELARGIAQGDLDPLTLQHYDRAALSTAWPNAPRHVAGTAAAAAGQAQRTSWRPQLQPWQQLSQLAPPLLPPQLQQHESGSQPAGQGGGSSSSSGRGLAGSERDPGGAAGTGIGGAPLRRGIERFFKPPVPLAQHQQQQVQQASHAAAVAGAVLQLAGQQQQHLQSGAAAAAAGQWQGGGGRDRQPARPATSTASWQHFATADSNSDAAVAALAPAGAAPAAADGSSGPGPAVPPAGAAPAAAGLPAPRGAAVSALSALAMLQAQAHGHAAR